MSEATNGKKGILLETGTNEFEIVEFTIGKVIMGLMLLK
jgi:two-component system chemotaxis response regulator CheV